MKLKIEINPQKVYASIIAYMISFLPLVNLVNGISSEIFKSSTSWDSYMLILIFLGMFAIGFYCLVRENVNFQIDSLIVFAVFVVTYLVSILVFSQNSRYLFTSWVDFLGNPVYVIFVLSLPGYVFARHLRDYSQFCYTMRIYAYIVVILSIVVFFFAKESRK